MLPYASACSGLLVATARCTGSSAIRWFRLSRSSSARSRSSYELNRKWAWRKGGKSHLWREVVPFWALTIIGWLASTGTVEIADSLCKSHGVTGLARAVAIMGASLFAYGVVWIGKFFLFNRLIFVTPNADPATDEVAGDAALAVGGRAPVSDRAPVSGPGPVSDQTISDQDLGDRALDGQIPGVVPVTTGTALEGNAGGTL
jgi:hypothetical protein